MGKKYVNVNYYSILVTISVFVLIFSTALVVVFLNKNSKEYSNIAQHGYIDSINPLLLEEIDTDLDKTSVNVDLINEIKRVYDIGVIYGDSSKTLVKSVDASALYDESKVNEMISNIATCLTRYPNNIFREIQNKGYNIQICIVDEFYNNNVALATRDSNNNFKIFLSSQSESTKAEKSIHHETYHILEYYMKLEYDINKLYADWNDYNPEGFEYISDVTRLDANYVYDLDKQGRYYFVTAYSKVSEKEDRAEVFADTMTRELKPSYYLDSLGAIKNKINLIVSVIDKTFDSVNSNNVNIYWARFL